MMLLLLVPAASSRRLKAATAACSPLCRWLLRKRAVSICQRSSCVRCVACLGVCC